MESVFQADERLGISVPVLTRDWTDYSLDERRLILERWEIERGQIPHQISVFEAEITTLQEAMHHEEEWEQTVALMEQINDYASRINDLNIWFRTQPDLEPTDDGATHMDLEL
ncbi:MAG: hypothetical protein OWT28_05895 [Firmicutes bacterium]|nr:hypothetical protein [Bacillota bacterium]